MQKHQKIAYAGPKASPKCSICQSIIACATHAIRKKNTHEKKKKKKMDEGLHYMYGCMAITYTRFSLSMENEQADAGRDG